MRGGGRGECAEQVSEEGREDFSTIKDEKTKVEILGCGWHWLICIDDVETIGGIYYLVIIHQYRDMISNVRFCKSRANWKLFAIKGLGTINRVMWDKVVGVEPMFIIESHKAK